jgi:hypothetical protein
MGGSEFALGITSSVDETDLGRAKLRKTRRIEARDPGGPDESASGSQVRDADAGTSAAGARPFVTKMGKRWAGQGEETRFEDSLAIEREGTIPGDAGPDGLEGSERSIVFDERITQSDRGEDSDGEG